MRQVISHHSLRLQERETARLVIPFLPVYSNLTALLFQSLLHFVIIITQIPANCRTRRDQLPSSVTPSTARSSRTAPPPARAYPNHRADLGAAGGAPSHGPRRRGGARKAAQLRCDATRRRHPPPPQPPPQHPSSAAAAASSCSSPGPARSSSYPCS